MTPRVKIGIVLLPVVILALYLFLGPVLHQNAHYHGFVDRRIFLGIPNTLDVLSNLGFLLVGLLGLNEVHRQNLQAKRSWQAFFLSILLIAPGSAYYHWSPDDHTLLWDRLPMSLGFMSLYLVLLTELVHEKLERLLPLFLFLGASSVLTWYFSGDLRFYVLVQYSSFFSIPLLLLLFRGPHTKKPWYLYALFFYLGAKFAEAGDSVIYRLTGEKISGHTVKHLLAAAALMGLWWMLKTRRKTGTPNEVPGNT
jgi:hypothetical protein